MVLLNRYQERLENAAVVAIAFLIAMLFGAAGLAWTNQGAAMWIELRLAEIAGCFGLL